MIKINRNITSDKVTSTSKSFKTCQASINSEGNIVLRNYSYNDNDTDEILILSDNETEAICALFSKIENISNRYSLPF